MSNFNPGLAPTHAALYNWPLHEFYQLSQAGGRGNFTYLLEGQIELLDVGRPIKQFRMLFSLFFLVSFDQHVFLHFYYKTIILPKIEKFQVRSFEKNLYHQKAYEKQHIRHYYGYPGFSCSF